jgi:two-component system, OmpR family, sensor kinase
MPDERAGRWSLASRITAVTMLAAGVAVLVAAVVSLGLFRTAAQDEGRKVLRNDANLVATTIEAALTTKAGRPRIPAQVAAMLRANNIVAAIVEADGTVTGPEGRPITARPLRAADLAQLQSGKNVSTIRNVQGGRAFVEARPLSTGGAIVLFEKVAAARSTEAATRLRLGIALGVGLLVAAGLGVLLARRLARPLQRAAAAAHRLSTGARDVRLEPDGPAEVAEVTDALNGLASALAVSEGRQRDFLLSVSHELRTPLTAVKGYAEALADGVVPAEAVSPTGHVLLAESGRLERLVSDLLDLARLGAQDFRIDLAPVDLVQLVRQAGIVWADRCAREGVLFGTDIRVDDGRPLVVQSDPTRLRQILDGLAENALRVTPSGRPIVFALVPSAHEVLLQVRDGGPGLTEDDCRVAFDRSALYDRYRGVRRVGTGVGLALVAGLASRLGGRAEAGRSPEGGACFTIRIPRG